MPNITTDHALTYTYPEFFCEILKNRKKHYMCANILPKGFHSSGNIIKDFVNLLKSSNDN